MSVWNRPMFAGARPPNSARAELERLRVGMEAGGVVPTLGGALDLVEEGRPWANISGVSGRVTPPPAEETPPPAEETPPSGLGSLFGAGEGETTRQTRRLSASSIAIETELEKLERQYESESERIRALEERLDSDEPRLVAGRQRAIVELLVLRQQQAQTREQISAARAVAGTRAGDSPSEQSAEPPPEQQAQTPAEDSPFNALKDAPPRDEQSAEPPSDEPDERSEPPSDEPPPFVFDPRLHPFGMSQTEITDFLRERYTAREALYDEILGDPDRRRAQARSEIFFEIAQRALQFAGGVGPDGQPMRGSMFAQAAQSFAPVFGSLAERSRELTDQERALRASRLEAAEGDLAREQGLRAEITRDQVRSLIEGMAAGQAPQPLTLEALLPTQVEIDQHVPNLPNIRKAYDSAAPFKNMANTAGAIIGMQFAPKADKAIVASQFINNRLLARLARNLQPVGKPSNFTLELSQQLLVEPGRFTTSVPRARNGFTEIQQAIKTDLKDEIEKFNTALKFRNTRAAQEAENNIRLLRVAYMEVSAMLDSLGGQRDSAGLNPDIVE